MAVEFHPNDTPEERIARFIIEKNFTLKKCQRYVKNNFGKKQFFKEDDCVCGQSVTWHLKNRAFNKSQTAKVEEWSAQKDTVPYPCDTFGELAFRAGFGVDQSQIVPGARAKYARVERRVHHAEQHFENIFTLMTDRNLWGLPVPQLIIEVTGSAFPLPHVDQGAVERFHSGIIAAAKSANAWIVTGGTNCGVMKLCGEAVTRARMTQPERLIPCIGIVSWGVINHRENLIGVDQNNNNYPQLGTRSPVPSNTNSPKLLPPLHATSNSLDILRTGNNQRRSSITSFSPEVVGKWPADYVVERQEGDDDEPSLDPGHTAFLFVDNGCEKRFGEEIEFRAQYLHFLSRKSIKASISDSGMTLARTPLVLLVIGGGPNTLKTVKYSTEGRLKKDGKQEERWPRPVVILSGFGGAADVLAFAYTITAAEKDLDSHLYRTSAAAVRNDGNDDSAFPPDFDDRLKRHPAFSDLCRKGGEIAEILTMIRACLTSRHLVTIVDLFDENEDSPNLDHAILNAIFKSSLLSDPATTFQLAQLWRRCDVAKQIFKQNPSAIRKQVDMKKAMTRAIEMGESSFFEFFIDHGLIDLKTYLTLAQMRTFYEDLFIKRQGKAAKVSCIQLFRSLLMNGANEETLSDLNNPKFMENVGAALASLLTCYMDNVFLGEKNRRRFAIINNNEDEPDYDQVDSRRGSFSSTQDKQNHRPYDTSERDLFILLLLLHRQEMAVLVWKLGHDHLGSALMAAIFLKSLSGEAQRLDMMDLAKIYDDHATKWQDRAIALLDYCYEQEPLRCNRLLARSLLMWQGLTVLEMAYYGKKKRIMEHAAIQMKMGQIWLGRMATFTKPSLIYLSIIPPLTPFLIFRLRFEESSVFQRNPADENKLTFLAGILALPMIQQSRYSTFGGRHDLEASRYDKGGDQYDSPRRGPSCCGRPCLGSVSPDNTLGMQTLNNTQTSTTSQYLGSDATRTSSLFGRKKYDDKKLLKASLTSPDQPGHISFFKAIYYLFDSPIVKFIVHSLALLTFLLLFSSFVLVGADPKKVSVVEIFIWITCAIYYADLIREGFGRQNMNFSEKLRDFCTDAWNMFDTTALAFLIAAVVQRFTVVPRDFIYPRTTYAVACVLYWVKSLHVFYVTKSLGPKVAGLFKLLEDVAFFLLMYIIILLAFSMPIHSLTRPESKIESVTDFLAILVDVAYYRMWQLFFTAMDDSKRLIEGSCRPVMFPNDNETSYFGSLFSSPNNTADFEHIPNFQHNFTLNETNSANITHLLVKRAASLDNSTLPLLDDGWVEPCSMRNIVAVLLFIIYLLLSNIVLVSMLVAMFAHTVTDQRQSAERVWRYNIYRFVREYYKKPVLPGPLMIFELTYRILGSCRRNKGRLPENNDFKEFYFSLDDFDYRKLEMFELSGVQSILSNNARDSGSSIRNRLGVLQEQISAKIEQVDQKIAEMRAELISKK